MKRPIRVLLGVVIVTALSCIPEGSLATTKRILEAMVVVHLCVEVFKR